MTRALTMTREELRAIAAKDGPNSVLRELVAKTSRAKPRDLEHQDQKKLIDWRDEIGRHAWPELTMLAAVPNGGKRGKLTAIKLKREGVSAGYPDLVLDVARGGYHGWKGELKAVGGSVSHVQRAWHEQLREHGYRVDVAFGWEAMRDCLLTYLALPDTWSPPR